MISASLRGLQGDEGIRTPVRGFADRSITPLARRRIRVRDDSFMCNQNRVVRLATPLYSMVANGTCTHMLTPCPHRTG